MDEDCAQPDDVDSDAPSDTNEAKEKRLAPPMVVSKERPPKDCGRPDDNKKSGDNKPMSKVEKWSLILGVFGVLVAGLTGAAVFWQARIASQTLREIEREFPELRKSADAAKSSADVASENLRPWVKASVGLRGPLVFSKNGGASIKVIVAIQNVGHSPALNVEPNVGLFAVHDNSLASDIHTDQTRFLGCQNYLSKRTKNLISTFGTTYRVIFPADAPVLLPYNVTMDARQVREGIFYLPGPHRPFVNLDVIGCVTYGQNFSHETGFVFELGSFVFRPGTVLRDVRLRKPIVNFGTYAR